MYLPNASLTNHYTISEQKNVPKAPIGVRMLKICLIPLVLTFRLLGALLTWVLFVVILAFLALLAVMFLIGAMVFGKKKLSLTKKKQAVPFCKQRSEGATSLLFIFLILAGMPTYLLSWVLPKKETLLQSKGTPIQEEAEMVTEYLYE